MFKKNIFKKQIVIIEKILIIFFNSIIDKAMNEPLFYSPDPASFRQRVNKPSP